MFTQMTLAGIERNVPEREVERYLAYGWKITGADQVPSTQVVEAGPIKARAPKKKAEKPAETAPEAATEDLGNAIKGE